MEDREGFEKLSPSRLAASDFRLWRHLYAIGYSNDHLEDRKYVKLIDDFILGGKYGAIIEIKEEGSATFRTLKKRDQRYSFDRTPMSEEEYYKWKREAVAGLIKDEMVYRHPDKRKMGKEEYIGGDYDKMMRMWKDIMESSGEERIILVEQKQNNTEDTVDKAKRQLKKGEGVMRTMAPHTHVDTYFMSGEFGVPVNKRKIKSTSSIHNEVKKYNKIHDDFTDARITILERMADKMDDIESGSYTSPELIRDLENVIPKRTRKFLAETVNNKIGRLDTVRQELKRLKHYKRTGKV